MSNLPPGVTGNEWQIAGADREFDDYRECDQPGIGVKTITLYGENQIKEAIESVLEGARVLRNVPTITQYPHDPPEPPKDYIEKDDAEIVARRLTADVSRLRAALSDIMLADVDKPCTWEGTVTVQVYDGMEQWECPLCRHQHENEVE